MRPKTTTAYKPNDWGRLAGGEKHKPHNTRKANHYQQSRQLRLWPDHIVKPIIKTGVVNLALAGFIPYHKATEIITGGYAHD